jgi:hypothetical protein
MTAEHLKPEALANVGKNNRPSQPRPGALDGCKSWHLKSPSA